MLAVAAARYAHHRTSVGSEPGRSHTAVAARRRQGRAARRRPARGAPAPGRAPRSRPAAPCISRSSRPARHLGRGEWCCSLAPQAVRGQAAAGSRRAALVRDVCAGQQPVATGDVNRDDEPSSASMTREPVFVTTRDVQHPSGRRSSVSWRSGRPVRHPAAGRCAPWTMRLRMPAGPSLAAGRSVHASSASPCSANSSRRCCQSRLWNATLRARARRVAARARPPRIAVEYQGPAALHAHRGMGRQRSAR